MERWTSNSLNRRDFFKTTAKIGASVGLAGMLNAIGPAALMAQTPDRTLKVLVSTDTDSYDPHAWLTDEGRMIGFHVMEPLITRDLEPVLTTGWENPDKLTWLFHLKKEVAFSNGEPFDASVVKFNLERCLDPKTKSIFRSDLAPVESISVVDKHVVKIKTKIPYATLVDALGDLAMISPKAVKESGDQIFRQPVGTGPYLLKEWVVMERSILTPNPAYRGVKPALEQIVFRPVPEPSTRIVELVAGKADIINKVPIELMSQITQQGLKVLKVRNIKGSKFKIDCSKPPFDNVKVRQAFNYAINKEEIVKYVVNDAAEIMADPLAGRAGPNDELKPYPYDPDKARKLLAEAGYPDGVDIEIISPSGRYLKDRETSEAVSFQVKKAGFNMKVTALEWGMFVKQFKSGNGYFIAGYFNTVQSFLGTNDSRLKTFTYMGYHDDEYNRLFDQSKVTFDISARNSLYRQMAKNVVENSVYANLFYGLDIYGVSNRVQNFVPRSDGYIVLNNVSIG